MKWKDFMANSLPRSWTKARRRGLNNKANDKANAEKPDSHVTNTRHNEATEFIKRHNHNNNLRYVNECLCARDPVLKVPQSSIIPRKNTHLATYNSLPKTNPYTQNIPDVKVANNDDDDDDRNDNGTMPRLRSRIKTNPWLPSPRIQPSSLHLSLNTNCMFSSPTSSRCSSTDRSLGSRSLNGSRSSSIFSRSRSFDSPKNRSHMDLTDMGTRFDDDCCSGSGKLSSGIGLASDGEGTSISSMESDGFVFYESLDDLRSSPLARKVDPVQCVPDRNDPAQCDPANDTLLDPFMYENHFESMVENLAENKSNRSFPYLIDPLAQPTSFERQFLSQSADVAEEKRKEDVDDGIGHSDDDDNVHIYENMNKFYTPTMIQTESTSYRADDNSNGRETTGGKTNMEGESESENEYNVQDAEKSACLIGSHEPQLRSLDHERMREKSELNRALPTATSTPKLPKRSSEEIRSSLQTKVRQLRREKFLVEEKIREAQEEERIRMSEKLRYQKLVTLQRKEVLVRTLGDLRLRLEGQCQRLQNSYTAVLQMQRDQAAPMPESSPGDPE